MNIQLFHKTSHADSLLTQLNLLRKRKVFTDVVLKAGSRSFPCHRAVLASCSRYFEAMFSGGLRESRDADVNFHDSLHPEVLELLLDYAYSARVIINEENAESLLEAGDMLQFHDIRDAAAEFLEKNLHQSNCLGMMLLSDAHQCQRLYELSWRMCLANFDTLFKTEDFLSLPKDKVQELILSEELEVEDESLVYEAVIDWVRADMERRHGELPDLLRCVRLALLPETYLLKNVASEELVMCHKVGREIVEDAVRCKMRILQNDGIVTGFCARPRKVSQALLLLGGQTFMCDKIYMIDNKTKEITPKTDIPSPRKECSACAIGCKVRTSRPTQMALRPCRGASNHSPLFLLRFMSLEGVALKTGRPRTSGSTTRCTTSGPKRRPCWWPGSDTALQNSTTCCLWSGDTRPSQDPSPRLHRCPSSRWSSTTPRRTSGPWWRRSGKG